MINLSTTMTYGSNDYLKGHQTQKRCGLCEHNPILLPSGSCLDCKTVNPPLFRGSTQPTESEVIAQRRPRQEMEAPVFSEGMRAPLAEVAGAGDARGAALATAPEAKEKMSAPPASADAYRMGNNSPSRVGGEAAAVDVAGTLFPDSAAAGVVLWTAEQTVLVGWDPKDKKWSLPGGKRERGESVRACATRELFEETGLRAEGLQIDWSKPEFITSGRYVYYQGQLNGHRPSSTRALTEFKQVHIHDSPVEYSFCLERAISNLRGGGKPRVAGLLDGFWEPEERAKRDYATSTQPAPSAGDVETSAGRVEQPPDRRQRPLGPRAAQSSSGLQPQQQGARTRAPRKRKAETVDGVLVNSLTCSSWTVAYL